jgi:single-strand DNA-binding protein
MNNVILGGRLTANPEIYNADSTPVAKFSLAVDRPIRKGEDKEVDFIPVTAFGKKAEWIGQYLAKGTAVSLIGRLHQSSFIDKTTGAKRSGLEVICDSIEFQLGNTKNSQSQNPQNQGQNQTPQQIPQNQGQNQTPQQIPNQGQNQTPQQNPQSQYRNQTPQQNPQSQYRNQTPQQNPNQGQNWQPQGQQNSSIPEPDGWRPFPTKGGFH